MALSEETLLDIIERGDIEACAHFFDAASEADRGGVAKTTVREYQKRWNASLEETRSSPASVETAKLAVIAAARLSDFKRLSAPVWINEEHEVAMLATRPPALIQGLVEWFVEDNPHMVRCVLHLVEAGLCRQPEHENFLLGLMAWWGHADEEEGGLIAILRAHPEFLEHDLWRLLGTEGNGEWSLAAHDKYSVDFQRWDLALVGLSEEASVSRDKLLDTTLDVLARDFAQFRSSWYSRLHEALRPTIDERARRAAAYMRLLGSSISPTVSFALKALAKLDKAKRLEPSPLLAHIGPALTAKTKSSATLALRLVGRAAASPEHKVDAALLIAAALDHESADIQGRALDMLERLDVLDEDEVREAVAGARDLIAPSVRKRLDMLLPPDSEDATPADIEPLPSEPVERTL
ncbi:MAG: DUF6493 family protein, partial [Planctomycetota bacterium]|nr:DUF6493 family protein [Planctomycetota bacterium]